jgi:hypothetical protein
MAGVHDPEVPTPRDYVWCWGLDRTLGRDCCKSESDPKRSS